MKIYRTSPDENLYRIAREAAEWVQAMKNPASPEERAAFLAWVGASPLHLREMLLAESVDKALAEPGALDGFDLDQVLARAAQEDNVVPLHTQWPVAAAQLSEAGSSAAEPAHTPNQIARRGGGERARRGQRWGRIAAVVAIFAVALAAWRLGAGSPGQATLYATTLGEQRVISLADGSVVTMAPSTRIEVALSSGARDIRLRAGEANFKVAHDKARPFRVHAGASVVQAVGTEFSVNRLPSGTVVAVTEGIVKLSADRMAALDDGIGAWLESWVPTRDDAISRPGGKQVALDAPRNLAAGARAHIARNGRKLALDELVRNQGNDAVAARLLFRDDTLADIAAEFNRFNAMQIVVEGDAARLQRYSGVFDARDSASFLEFLRCCSSLNVTREGEKTVVRQPAQVADRR